MLATCGVMASSRELYQEQFDPDAYLSTYFSFCEQNEPTDVHIRSTREWQLAKFHRFYSTLQLDAAVDKRLHILEFGGGPGLYSLVSAAPYAEEIVFSEFVARNREVVDAWKKKGPVSAYRPIIRYVVQSVEGRADEEVDHREQELRDKIVSVVPSDISQDPPVADPQGKQTYDVLSTHFCLLTACESISMYRTALQKLSALVRPGGYIIASEILGASFYMVGGIKFPNILLTGEVMRQAFTDAGFSEELSFHSLPLEPSEVADGTDYVIVTARKP
ncbi:nicotinamide N-methyltransferase-like [Corticium candelabrum]|uniref:nicotinamide N-methyltransferase-like n=1 Tax=Corticium candelabrum TaxID=121492 RepID=UPI002E2734E8|nr:nicotinamide N-methyltransferase-like [Corticium candelabrum]